MNATDLFEKLRRENPAAIIEWEHVRKTPSRCDDVAFMVKHFNVTDSDARGLLGLH